MKGFVLMSITLGYEESISESLLKMDSVKRIERVSPVYDFVIESEWKSKEELTKSTGIMRSIEHVRSILVLVCIE